MKTLLISYLPRNESSNTKKLSDYVKNNIKGELIELDLTKEPPDFFLPDTLSAYINGHYLKKDLTPKEEKALAKMKRFTGQFKSADVIVMAFPMHNFGLPGIVKTYFDSILLKGETWDLDSNGYRGLMKNKKALLLSSSGGNYQDGPYSSWDHALPMANQLFQFMGFSEIEKIPLSGMNNPSNNIEEKITEGNHRIKEILAKWKLL